MMKAPIVEVCEVTKYFPGRAAPVLSGASLTLAAGEITLLLGRSGSGKSTLLHCIAGLEPFDRGEITVGESPLSPLGIEELAALRLRRMGIVFQFFNLIEALTVEQNIFLPFRIAPASSSDAKEFAEELMELVGIQGIRHKYPREISGGEAQRTAIARALVLKPEILLADEPTGNLDYENAEAVMNLFRQLVEELHVGIFLVSHERAFQKVCDRTYEMTADGGTTEIPQPVLEEQIPAEEGPCL
ncbi:ABC transporter ATP-binding protein [bacterium]|nr:ABC transporter ATP-binding protein [bacterium]